MLAGTGRPMIEWVRRLAAQARQVVAVGSCAAFGGITAGGVNPADACGLQYDGAEPGGLLGTEFRARSGLPAINIAGCPTHPDWVMETLLMLARDELARADLDELARPRFYADVLVHHGCRRNEFYEFKASAQQMGEQGCLMEHLGCKGTQAHADCNLRPWHGNGSCLVGGYPCIRCTEPGFEEPGHPFLSTPKVAGIPIGLPLDMPKAWFVALAAAMGVQAPENGRLVANLVQAVENVADHLTHFYLFFMPDFARESYAGQPWWPALATRFKAITGSAANDFLPARANLLRAMGLLAGKWPPEMALRCGRRSGLRLARHPRRSQHQPLPMPHFAQLDGRNLRFCNRLQFRVMRSDIGVSLFGDVI